MAVERLEVGSRRRVDGLAEFAVKPSEILVHDPVSAGAFRSFVGHEDDRLLEEKLLFREGLWRRDGSARFRMSSSMLNSIGRWCDASPSMFLSPI